MAAASFRTYSLSLGWERVRPGFSRYRAAAIALLSVTEPGEAPTSTTQDRSSDASGTASATAVLPPFTAALGLALAPVRVNLIAAGFVDTPLSAALLGGQLEERRNELRATLPIGRVVGPGDVAALAVQIMINTALTGATYDIDGDQQFVS
jgi:NAD(P)-dependent dehydrogenase (short-subunit alcohol dehydrogenase family)